MLGGAVSDDEAEVVEDRLRRMAAPLPPLGDPHKRAAARLGDLYEGAPERGAAGGCAHTGEEKFELDGACAGPYNSGMT